MDLVLVGRLVVEDRPQLHGVTAPGATEVVALGGVFHRVDVVDAGEVVDAFFVPHQVRPDGVGVNEVGRVVAPHAGGEIPVVVEAVYDDGAGRGDDGDVFNERHGGAGVVPGGADGMRGEEGGCGQGESAEEFLFHG